MIMSEKILEVKHLGKAFGSNQVLRDIDFSVSPGDVTCIIGPSGSGKSTCMNIIGCLDVPTYGTYRLNGRDVGKMNRDELADVRNEMLGFIFQQYNLLPRLLSLIHI